MRILNLLNRDHRRGAEAFGVALGEALGRCGHDVETVALTGSREGPRFTIATLTKSGTRLPATLLPLRRKSREFDVVIGHGGDCLLACALGLNGTGVPFIYRSIGDPEFWTTTWARRRRVQFGLRRATAIAVYHEAAAKVLASRYGLERSKVRVLAKGIDTASITPATEETRRDARRELGLPLDARVVVYLGALSEEKNVGQLIDAMGHLPEVTMLVVGRGPCLDELRRRGRALGERVVFHGAVEDPAQVLAAADVVALTSRSEGVPTVALEAALAALPVVATDVGGVREVVIDSVTGFLVPLDDSSTTAAALDKAIDDSVAMGAEARNRCVEHFDIGKVASDWSTFLDETISKMRAMRR